MSLYENVKLQFVQKDIFLFFYIYIICFYVSEFQIMLKPILDYFRFC